MWIKRNVVMLPTNEKATSSIMLGVMPNVAALTKDVLDDTHDWMKFGKPQHLYFLSDEEIKEDGDWIYKRKDGYETIQKATLPLNLTSVNKKIIATTDKNIRLLEIVKEDGNIEYPYITPFPQPSQSFIEKFVEEYNKGNVITEVMVEYENYYASGALQPNLWQIKVAPKDNTIIIRKVKDSWNKEEVMRLVLKMQYEYTKYKQDCHFGPNLREIAEWTDEWLEQNI